MSNAKTELLEFCKEYKVNLICAEVEQVYYAIDKADRKTWRLPAGYSADDLQQFLEELNFEYDDSLGSQYLDGTLWLDDAGYADRGEYDGSEWWEYHKTPPTPPKLSQRLSQTKATTDVQKNAKGQSKETE